MANSDVQNNSASEPAISAATQPKELLHFAAYNLGLRYDQVKQDIKYMEDADRFYWQAEFSKYFEDIQGKILPPLDKVNQIKNDLASPPDNLIGRYLELSRALEGESGELSFQEQWQVFRLAIEQRMVLKYRNFLNKVDIVIRDCFYALRGVQTLTGISSKQLAPIAMLGVNTRFEFQPSGLAVVPVIIIPFDRMDTPWNLCSIHHEVGHELFHRLTIKNPDLSYFKENVRTRMDDLLAEQNPAIRIVSKYIGPVDKKNYYLFWLKELVADMIGVMLAGPTFINSLQEILIADDVFTGFDSAYPASYFRVMFNIIFARDILGHKTEADRLLNRWEEIFSQDDHIARLRAKVDGTSDESQLSSETINQWLSCLVKAVWEAGITRDEKNIGEVNLHKIYKQISLGDYKERFYKYRITQLDQEQQIDLQTATKKSIVRAQKKLVDLRLANCWPRYLVSALRLAYEQKIRENKPEEGWEEKLNRCFLSSVTELTRVANFFSWR